MSTVNYNLPQWENGDEFRVIGQLNPAFTTIDTELNANKITANAAKSSADGKVAYGKVKLVEDSSGNGVIVTLGVVDG